MTIMFILFVDANEQSNACPKCFCMHIYLPWYSVLCMHSISLVSMHLSLDSMKAVLLSDSFFLEFSRKHLRLKYLLLHQRNDIFMWQQLFSIIIDLFMTPDLIHSMFMWHHWTLYEFLISICLWHHWTLYMTPDLMHSICLCDIIELCMTPELLVHSSSASHVEYRASDLETIIQPVGRQSKA